MTTPDERSRALEWGRELLTQIADDETATVELRCQAKLLLEQYPTPCDLLGLVQADATQLPRLMADAFAGTAALLGRVLRLGTGGEHFRHDVRATLRHFPDEATCELMMQPFAGRRIRSWLLPSGLLELLNPRNAKQVPVDFPRGDLESISGAQAKLAVREVDGKFVESWTEEERFTRFSVCEDLVMQLVDYCRRRLKDLPGVDLPTFLPRVQTGLRAKDWDFSEAESQWIMKHVAQRLSASADESAERWGSLDRASS